MAKEKTGKSSANAFAGASDALGLGVDALFAQGGSVNEFDVVVNLDDIEVKKQVREEFEDDENSLAELGRSLRKRQLQAIAICPNVSGAAKPYFLIAGERRYRAARLEGLTTLRARVFDLTVGEVEDAQFAENIHRKNLTQIEEAKKIQRDLDELGSVEAVLAKHDKGRPWLSKMLSLLHLPEQAKRLVTERVSADLEVINAVKVIEKASPAKAKTLVDDLKQGRGKVNAREKVAAVKDEVKPSKKAKAGPKGAGGGSVASAKDRSHEEPSAGEVFAGAKSKSARLTPAQLLAGAYDAIFEGGKRPATVLEAMTDGERDAADEWLRERFEAGKKTKDFGRVVIAGLRSGHFATDGEGALGLVAFLHGAEGGVQFDLLNVFGAVK